MGNRSSEITGTGTHSFTFPFILVLKVSLFSHLFLSTLIAHDIRKQQQQNLFPDTRTMDSTIPDIQNYIYLLFISAGM